MKCPDCKSNACFECGHCKCEDSKWISVKDRLPEKYKEVLCYRKQEGQDEIIISHLSWMLDDDPIWCDEVSNYTYWMPLPPSPNDEHFRDATKMIDKDQYDRSLGYYKKNIHDEYSKAISDMYIYGLGFINTSLAQEKDDSNSSQK